IILHRWELTFVFVFEFVQSSYENLKPEDYSLPAGRQAQAMHHRNLLLQQEIILVERFKLLSGILGQFTCFVTKAGADIRRRVRVRPIVERKPEARRLIASFFEIKPGIIFVFAPVAPIWFPSFVESFIYDYQFVMGN